MRKLAKSFSKQYNFKRLLQTTPNLSKLYNVHEDAVNSIQPIKYVQILQRTELRAYDSDVIVDINAACDIEIYGPGQKSWPCRIKYAEQILDVYKHNYSAWSVRVGHIDQPKGRVKIVEFKNPFVTLYYPTFRESPRHNRPIYGAKKLSRLDQNDYVTHFLSGKTSDPASLQRCGIIPNGRHIFNSTFYDREIAHLYAESLQVEVDKWHEDRLGQGIPKQRI